MIMEVISVFPSNVLLLHSIFLLQYYRVNKQLPPFPQYAPDFDITMMKAPKDQGLQPDAFPSWCRVGIF